VRQSIGRRPIASLSPYDVERYFRTLKAKGMAESSVRQVRAMLHRACRLAKKWSGGALPNPVADTELPSWSLEDKTHVRAPSVEEVRRILELAESEDIRIAVALRVVAATGMRRGAVPAVADAASAQPLTGWTSVAPNSAGQPGPAPSATVSPSYNNDIGCGGYYTGTNPLEMQCRGVAVTVNSAHVAIRQGFWTGSNGFGWSKAYYYHNLWMQPMLDTIHLAANPTGSNSSRDYEVYHYTNGQLDQEVVVVADIQDASFQGVGTPDHYAVGVITGYCNNAAGALEPTCPDWVDQTL
jgi:hypothetical protein